MSVVYDKNNVPELLKRIADISNKGIQVGILGDADGEVLLYASVHEFGSPSNNIPERSFIRKAFDANKSDIEKSMESFITKYIDGSISIGVLETMAGEYLVGLVKDTIKAMKSPPLKDKTIEAKGSSGLLVDSGQLIDSITYKMVEV